MRADRQERFTHRDTLTTMPVSTSLPRSSNNNKSVQSNLGTGRVVTMHRPKPKFRRFMHFLTAMPQTPHWLQWGAPKITFPVDQSSNPTTCLIPGPVRLNIPNRIHIRSAVLPQCTGQADTQTDRQLAGIVDDNRPLVLYKELRSLITGHGLKIQQSSISITGGAVAPALC